MIVAVTDMQVGLIYARAVNNRAIMSKPIEWTQDMNSLTLAVEVKRTTKSKLNVTVYPTMVKISIPERNWIAFVDLSARVNYAETRDFDYNGQFLSLYLRKESPGIWGSLEPDSLSREELRERRQQAMQEREEYEAGKFKRIDQVREDLSQKALDNRIEQDRERRHEVERAKDEEKQKAIEAISSTREQPEEGIEDKGMQLFSDADRMRLASRTADQRHAQTAVRRTANEPVQLTFTKKVYPHLAMRDKYLFEPPKPKRSEFDKDEKVDALWLKDKGDEFLRNKDFESALRAYNETLKAKPDFLGCIANKSLLLLMNGDIKGSFDLIEYFERVYNELSTNEQNYTVNRRIRDVMIKRKVFLLMNKGQTVEATRVTAELSKGEVLLHDEISEEELQALKAKAEELNSDSKAIACRNESNAIKQEGDRAFALSKHSEAMELYYKALEVDGANEKAMSNLAQLYLRQGDFERALEVLDRLRPLAEAYRSQFASLQHDSPFRAFIEKLYMRYVRVYKALGQMDKAKESCRALLKIDPQSSFVKRELKALQAIDNKNRYFELKEEFKQLFKQGEYREALAKLKYSTELLEFEDDPVETLCLGLNKILCYNQLASHYETISETIRAFKLLRNLESNLLNKELRLKYEQNKARLREIEIRLYARRANALAQTGQYVSARQDLEQAKLLDPDNSEVLQLLNTINNA